MKDGWGVIVGRFQVNDLHEGHMELLRQVKTRHDGIIVFVGVNPAGLTKDNPLDFPTRRAMIQAKFPDIIVLPLQDEKTDDVWSEKLDGFITSAIGGIGSVTLYGGRDSFVPHYTGRFKPRELTLPVEISEIKGTDIRREFANKVIESPEFRAGMIYAAAHLWPVLLPTVDIAIFTGDYEEVLLGRKAGEKRFRFIGGHVEKKKLTLEGNARAEVLEEAGLDPNAMEYIGSVLIPDWRYATVDRAIMTAFFATTTMSMAATAGDDIEEVRWFKTRKLTTHDLVDTHHVLFPLLVKFLENKLKNTVLPASPKIYAATDRPESAGNTLRQAINKEEAGRALTIGETTDARATKA